MPRLGRAVGMSVRPAVWHGARLSAPDRRLMRLFGWLVTPRPTDDRVIGVSIVSIGSGGRYAESRADRSSTARSPARGSGPPRSCIRGGAGCAPGGADVARWPSAAGGGLDLE